MKGGLEMTYEDFLASMTPEKRELWERIQVLKAEAKDRHRDTQELLRRIAHEKIGSERQPTRVGGDPEGRPVGC